MSGSTSATPVATERRVGGVFIGLYALAYLSTALLFIAPLLVTLALKVNALVGIDRAPANLSLIAGVGALVSIVANPVFGQLSDRTTSRFGMRRPWMIVGLAGGSIGILVVALAPNVAVVLLGWCMAQVFFNALLAAEVAVLPDQVPVAQRGTVAGILGVCLPLASVGGTYVVNVFAGNELAMFMVPCAIGGLFVVIFALVLDDRRLSLGERTPWSFLRSLAAFYVDPRRHPDFMWAFASRFLFVLAYALLVTYQAYYLLERLDTAEDDVPRLIFLGTLAQAAVLVTASVTGGRLSDRTGRRKVFVVGGSFVYGVALFLVALATDVNGFLVGMAVSGLGFGLYMAVDLALVADVLPDEATAAKDLGVLNIAGALPFTLAPAIAPAILAVGSGSYVVLYCVAAVCALLAGLAILPVRQVR